MRVLVCSTGGAGHFTPLLAFANALADAGHELRFVVPAELEARVGHAYELGATPPGEERLLARVAELEPHEAAVLANRELFGRLWTAAMQPAVERAVVRWRPELVLREPCEYASAVSAERHGIPHAQVAISLAQVEWSSLELAAPVLGDALARRIKASPYLSRFPAPLDPSPFADTRRYREPTEPPSPLPNWWPQSADPLVYVTFGTVAGGLAVGRRALTLALAAVRGLPARVLITTGGATAPQPGGDDGRGVAVGGEDDRRRLPDNVHVEGWVPQADVLAEAAVVVCHGGSGTAFGALAAGVPLVLVPLFADQRPNAAVLARTGAALVCGLEDGAEALRAAIDSALATPTYRRCAAPFRAAALRAPGPHDALCRPSEPQSV